MSSVDFDDVTIYWLEFIPDDVRTKFLTAAWLVSVYWHQGTIHVPVGGQHYFWQFDWSKSPDGPRWKALCRVCWALGTFKKFKFLFDTSPSSVAQLLQEALLDHKVPQHHFCSAMLYLNRYPEWCFWTTPLGIIPRRDLSLRPSSVEVLEQDYVRVYKATKHSVVLFFDILDFDCYVKLMGEDAKHFRKFAKRLQ